MSATNPVESNLEAVLAQIKEESCRRAPSSRRHEHASDEILVAQILTATSDIEQRASAGGLDPGAALSLVAARTLTLTEASGVAIGLVVGEEVVCRANAGTAPDVGARIEIDKGLSGECIRTGRVVRSDDTTQDARVDPAACAALSLHSAIAVPIRFAENVIGVFEVFSAEPNVFDDWAVLALSQIAHFIAGIAKATLAPPPIEAVPPAAPADPRPSTPAESSERRLRQLLQQIALRHGRVALFLLAGLATVVAASYRVRDMMHSARAHRRAEVTLPAPLRASAEQAPASASAVPPDPAIAREDGRIPDATITRALQRAEGGHELHPSAPSPTIEAMSAPTRPLAAQSAGGPLRPLDVPPSPPAMAAVQPATQPGTAMAPVMKVPVAGHAFAAASPAPETKSARPSLLGLIPRKLKALVQKDQKKTSDKPKPAAADPGPQTAGPSE